MSQPDTYMHNYLSTITLCLLFIICATASAEVADTTRLVELGEAVVFSQPKEEGGLRQQPLSVSRVSADQLSQNHVKSLKELGAMAPNFFMPQYGSRQTSAIYIRGIGSRINTPAVGLYVDNIPSYDKSAFDTPLYDIAQIEVLRGPQSTMFGRNTMGGLVRIHTRNPFVYKGTDIRIGLASGNWARNASITHNQRVSDKFAFSAGAYYEGNDGFFRNDSTNQAVDYENAGGARFRALYRSGRGFKLDANVSFDFSRAGAYPYYYKGAVAGAKEQYPKEVDKLLANREGTYRRSVLNAGVNAEYQKRTWTLNSVTGFQYLDDDMFMDQDFLKEDIFTLGQKQQIFTISEEVTLKQQPANWWHGISGANFYYQSNHTKAPVTFCKDGVAWLNTLNPYSKIGGNELLFDNRFSVPTMNAALFHQSTFIAGPFSTTLGVRADFERNWFSSESRYAFTHTPDYKGMKMQPSSIATALWSNQHSNQWQVMPRLAVRYELPESKSDAISGNVYAMVSRGYRSGGYNIQNVSELLQAQMKRDMILDVLNQPTMQSIMGNMPPATQEAMKRGMMQAAGEGAGNIAEACKYKPEYAWNFELGTHLDLWQRRLQLDASAFWSEVSDLQLSQMTASGLGRVTVNAGRSRSIGAEVSARIEPVEHLSVVANYGFTYAVFRDYQISESENLKGNYVPYMPQHTFSLDAAYRIPIGKNHFVVAANVNGAGRIYWTERNNVSQPFYALLGARVGYVLPHFEAFLWGKNLTDTDYTAFYFESSQRGYAQKGNPIQVGIDLHYKF